MDYSINKVLELLSNEGHTEALNAVNRLLRENRAMRKILVEIWGKQLEEE